MTKSQSYYKGRKVFVGIDVHKKTYAVCVLCNGIKEKIFTMPAIAEDLVSNLQKWFPGAKLYSAYEASFSGLKLHRTLKNAGIYNIVFDPSSMEVSKVEVVKTDKKDAFKIAEQLSLGRLRSIYIPSEQEEQYRQVNRLRDQIVQMRTSTSNRIKGRLRFLGFNDSELDRPLSKKYLLKILQKEMGQDAKISLEFLINQWLFMTDQLALLKKEFVRQASENEYLYEIYNSAPGFGPITSQVLSNELGDLSLRFKNQKSLYQYIGLVPREYSSGEKIKRGGIHRRGAGRIRKVLIEAAWRAIREDSVLKDFYQLKSAQIGKNKAIVAVARKMIGRLRACFIYEELYCLDYHCR